MLAASVAERVAVLAPLLGSLLHSSPDIEGGEAWHEGRLLLAGVQPTLLDGGRFLLEELVVVRHQRLLHGLGPVHGFGLVQDETGGGVGGK